MIRERAVNPWSSQGDQKHTLQVDLGEISANQQCATSFRSSNRPANRCLSKMKIVSVERVVMVVSDVVVVGRCSNPGVFECEIVQLPSKGVVDRPFCSPVCLSKCVCVLWFRRICWWVCRQCVEGVVVCVSVCRLCLVADMSPAMVVCWTLKAGAVLEMV